MGDKPWRREHCNGMDALVDETADFPGEYSLGAVPTGGDGWLMRRFQGTLDQAQSLADAMARCADCRCPPWQP
jgi:hypothetical protein